MYVALLLRKQMALLQITRRLLVNGSQRNTLDQWAVLSHIQRHLLLPVQIRHDIYATRPSALPLGWPRDARTLHQSLTWTEGNPTPQQGFPTHFCLRRCCPKRSYWPQTCAPSVLDSMWHSASSRLVEKEENVFFDARLGGFRVMWADDAMDAGISQDFLFGNCCLRFVVCCRSLWLMSGIRQALLFILLFYSYYILKVFSRIRRFKEI